MSKQYVLDTSTLLNAGKSALKNFGNNQVIIPMGVIRQLELHSKDNELGWIARSVLRELENLRASNPHVDISRDGVPINEEGGILRVEMNHSKNEKTFPPSAQEASNTLRVAYNLQNESASDNLILVSNDLTQRLMASTLSIQAEKYQKSSRQGEYEGVTVVDLKDENGLNSFYEKDYLTIDKVPDAESLPNHHGFILQAGGSGALAVKEGNRLVNVKTESINNKVSGRSAEQRLAIHHLMNPEIDIVSLGGPAGTGKTLLALAAGYKQVRSDSLFKKLLVFRPLHEVGKQEIGFLPGTEEEKMEPWTQAVKDALEVFLEPSAIRRSFEIGEIEVSPTSFIRGRTISNAFIIIDEAQNFEKLTLLSILSRLGPGSKCVLSWDAAQQDNLFINKNDGVVAVVDLLKDEDIVAHVTLKKSERSRSAELATRVLEELDY